MPKDLPRVRIEHDLTDAEKPCPDCGDVRIRFGEDSRERLDYRPASFFIVEHAQLKYVCRKCAGQIVAASAPAEALPKCIAGAGLLAHVIVSKYQDHLPLHRLEGILGRHGVELSRSTLADWLTGCAAALAPLYLVMCDRVRKSKVIHTDDTPVTTLDRDDPDGRKTGRVWVYLGDREHPYTVYDMTASRSRDGPKTFLDGFKGYLQADAFGGYDGLYARGVTEVACWRTRAVSFTKPRRPAPPKRTKRWPASALSTRSRAGPRTSPRPSGPRCARSKPRPCWHPSANGSRTCGRTRCPRARWARR